MSPWAGDLPAVEPTSRKTGVVWVWLAPMVDTRASPYVHPNKSRLGGDARPAGPSCSLNLHFWHGLSSQPGLYMVLVGPCHGEGFPETSPPLELSQCGSFCRSPSRTDRTSRRLALDSGLGLHVDGLVAGGLPWFDGT
jgi:hypothetical protein